MEDDTLAHHTAYTVQEPCRAEEVENGDNDTWNIAEVEGCGEDAEDRDERVKAEDDAHTWHILGSDNPNKNGWLKLWNMVGK